MYLTDVREDYKNLKNPIHTAATINRIIVKQTDASTTNILSHYVVLPSGRMEYRIDCTIPLEDPNTILITVLQADSGIPPEREQCESLRLLFSYLLLPRTITPLLISSQQIHLYPLQKTVAGITRGNEASWFRTLFEGNIHRLPPLLAEYKGQEILQKTLTETTIAFYFKNTGSRDWVNTGDQCMSLFVSWEEGSSSYLLRNHYRLAEGTSLFYHPSWIDSYCPSHLLESRVKPGEKATFRCTVSTKLAKGNYREDFGIATEHQWVDNIANGNKANKAHCWIEISL